MTRVVVLGAGIAGHTAALHLKRKLGSAHDVIVVSPNSKWNWIPSNIWVGVGKMTIDQVTFPLAPIYKAKGIEFHQALATEIHPEGDAESDTPFVVATSTVQGKEGEVEKIAYDYLINCTGPKLNFGATPGLGPDNGFTMSVCTAAHALEASKRLKESIDRVKKGEHLRFVIGTGHGTCTCQGAAFEYTFNVEHELREAGVRDKAEVIYFTNEAQLGDLGVGGMTFDNEGYQTTSDLWTESLFRERGVQAIIGAHATKIEEDKISYEQLDGSMHELPYDFAMLIPPFKGQDLKAIGKDGSDINDKLFNPAGFLKVDANYAAGAYENWKASDWPKTYQNPTYGNIYAAGIAFAPPHQISKPRTTPNGTVITPAPPRTGMPSGMIAKAVAYTIADRVLGNGRKPHEAPMTNLGAACVASAGNGLFSGSAAAMTMNPVVPDWEKFPTTGRDIRTTTGEIGLAGHWVKFMLHVLFIYKAKARPFWWVIPE